MAAPLVKPEGPPNAQTVLPRWLFTGGAWSWRLIAMGHSYREMSQRMGVAEGTLRVRVLRCREKAVAVRRELGGAPARRRNAAAAPSPNLGEGAPDDEL